MKLMYTVLVICVCIQFGQSQTDTTLISRITGLKVVGYDSHRGLKGTPGAVTKISPRDLNLFQTDNILFGVNLSPGVRMEERSPGSYRIAIRGSSLRSPFGVRNVKVYWNGIPFTDPTGSTAFNLLDPVNISEIDLIRGPAGSTYGAGNGGVLHILSDSPTDTSSYIQGKIGFGSFGLQKYSLKWSQAVEKGVISTKLSHQQSEGYREHSSLDRTTLEVNGKFQTSNRRKIGMNLLYSDLYYDIPGGLNLDQLTAHRTQARPGNPFVLGSVESKSGIDQEYVLLGLQQQYIWNQHWQNETVVYGDFSRFRNPFNLDYKRDLRTSYGVRSKQDYYSNLASVPIKYSVGVEWQQGSSIARNFENDYGKPGLLNFDDEINSFQLLVFAKAELELNEDMFLSIGLSQNQLKYSIDRLTDRALDSAYLVERSFDPVYVPRIGWSVQLDEWALHASVSYGFSPPTIDEIRTNEGSINESLEAEQGTNFEIGTKVDLLDKRLYLEGNIFYFLLDETIVQQQSDRGTVLFLNSGATQQAGLELQAKYGVFDKSDACWQKLNLGLTYAYHHFKFKDYKKYENGEDRDYSDNFLPGVAPHTFTLHGHAMFKGGWFVNGSFQYVDAIYLNDANTVSSDAYQDVKFKLGWQFNWAGKREAELSLGVNNLLDQSYSLGNDLNAFGGRYYQPAPGINYYLGCSIKI